MTKTPFFRTAACAETLVAVATRFTEERTRLNMNQSEFARLAGISHECLRKIQNGQNLPSAPLLISAHQLGLDILYVLTGQRSQGATAQDRAVADAAIQKAVRTYRVSIRCSVKYQGMEYGPVTGAAAGGGVEVLGAGPQTDDGLRTIYVRNALNPAQTHLVAQYARTDVTREVIVSRFMQGLRSQGKPLAQWAKERGFSREIVSQVIAGQLKGVRGESHQVAVALGLK